MKKTLALLLGMIFIFLLANLALKESAVYSAAAACNVVILLRLRTLLMIVDDNFQEIKLAASMYLQGVRLLLYTGFDVSVRILVFSQQSDSSHICDGYLLRPGGTFFGENLSEKKQQSFYNILKR